MPAPVEFTRPGFLLSLVCVGSTPRGHSTAAPYQGTAVPVFALGLLAAHHAFHRHLGVGFRTILAHHRELRRFGGRRSGDRARLRRVVEHDVERTHGQGGKRKGRDLRRCD